MSEASGKNSYEANVWNKTEEANKKKKKKRKRKKKKNLIIKTPLILSNPWYVSR